MILEGSPPIEVTVRKSARARRISLRVSSLDGRVTLTLPKAAAHAQAVRFLEEKADWIRGHLDAQPEQIDVGIGVAIPLEGQQFRLCEGEGRSIVPTGDELHVPGPSYRAHVRVRAWLKDLARDRLLEASDRHAAALGQTYNRITLRDTRSRWGSCSSEGNLMYSWRLILAPPEVLDYVAAHEVAHLVEMNHSRAFWGIVEDLMPGYQVHRRWLRENGARLHRYRFGD